MASLNSWLSPAVMRALGWALIHSLWQCLAVAALAALLMAFSRRPPLRYMIAVSALAVMLATPAATFFVLMDSPAAQAVPLPGAFSTTPVNPYPLAAAAPLSVGARVIGAMADSPLLLRSQSTQLLPWVVAAWLAGVACFSLRFVGGFLLLERKRRQSFAPDARILALSREIQGQLGIARAIRYLECSWLQAPAVIGWLRPIVLLPVTTLTGLSEAQLRAVIAHELAHIRRLDVFVNLFQIFVEALLFYHPAVWWLNRRIRAERELCCDEIALEVSGDRLDYAKALTLMAAWEAAPRLAMAANSGVLSERVFHVLGRPSSGMGQRMIGLTGSVLFLAAALASANALFGAGSAIPIAQARESVKITLQTALSNVSDRARQIFPAGEPAGQDASTAAVVSKAEPAKDAAKLAPPPADLSQLLPKPTLSTPAVSLDARSANRPAPPVAASSNGPGAQVCHNSGVSGRVISPTAIQLQGFVCILQENRGVEPLVLTFGSCPYANENPYAYSITTSNRFGRFACKFDVTMGVRLADPADAALMQPGKSVTLSGDFRVATQNRSHYLAVANAKFVRADNPPAAVPPPQPTAVQVSLSTPLPEMSPVHFCRNRSVFGQVTAADTVAIQGFTCFVDGNPTDTVSARDIPLGACPLASSTTSYKLKCKFDVVLNVRLANPADAQLMVPGKLVRLGGDFRTWKEDKLDYVAVTNAKVLFTDYYWMGGVSSLPLPMGPPNFSNGNGGTSDNIVTQPSFSNGPAPQ